MLKNSIAKSMAPRLEKVYGLSLASLALALSLSLFLSGNEIHGETNSAHVAY